MLLITLNLQQLLMYSLWLIIKLLNFKEFLDYPVIELPDNLINKVLNGNSIINTFNITKRVIFTYKSKDIAIYEVSKKDLKPLIMF